MPGNPDRGAEGIWRCHQAACCHTPVASWLFHTYISSLIRLDEVDVSAGAHRCGVSRGNVAAIRGLLDGGAIVDARPTAGSGPNGITGSIGPDEVDIAAACSERAGPSADDVAPVRGLPEGVGLIRTRPSVGSGPDRIPRGIGLNEVDVGRVCPEGIGVAGDDVAPVRGLFYGATLFIARSAVGPGPERIAGSIRLDEVDVLIAGPEGRRESCDDVAAVRGLPNGVAFVVAPASVGPGPKGISRGIGLEELDIKAARSEGRCVPGDDVPPVRGLLHRVAFFVARSPVGSGPKRIARSTGLDDVDVVGPRPEGESVPCDDVARIRGLLDRQAIIVARSPTCPGPDRVSGGIRLDEPHIQVREAMTVTGGASGDDIAAVGCLPDGTADVVARPSIAPGPPLLGRGEGYEEQCEKYSAHGFHLGTFLSHLRTVVETPFSTLHSAACKSSLAGERVNLLMR